MGSVQITGLSHHQPPNPEPSQQLGSAFPRIQQEKKKKRKRKAGGPGVVGQAGALEPSRLSCPSGAVCSRVSTRAGWPSLFWSPGFSLPLRPALDSQPRGLHQWPRSAGGRGAAVLEKTPAVSLLWKACPGTGGSSEF